MRRIYRLSTTGELLQEGQAFFDGAYYRPAEFLARASTAELTAANVSVTEGDDLPVALITAADVDQERDRRLRHVPFGGRIYDYIDGRGSEANIAGASTLALGAIINGAQPGNCRWADPERDFIWIAADNQTVAMDAQTMFAFGQAVAVWKARHIWAARSIKDSDPIPADYNANSRWPS